MNIVITCYDWLSNMKSITQKATKSSNPWGNTEQDGKDILLLSPSYIFSTSMVASYDILKSLLITLICHSMSVI